MRRILPSPRPARHRFLSTSRPRLTSWTPGPSPPRLPKEEQEIFEQLQRQSTGAFSTPRAAPQINQSPHSQPETQTASTQPPASENPLPVQSQQQQQQQQQTPRINQSPQSEQNTTASRPLSDKAQSPQQAVRTGSGEELHPNVRRGAAPEFEGTINPKTGESGGPKNEPLRWGGEGDWSYNGRVTDF